VELELVVVHLAVVPNSAAIPAEGEEGQEGSSAARWPPVPHPRHGAAAGVNLSSKAVLGLLQRIPPQPGAPPPRPCRRIPVSERGPTGGIWVRSDEYVVEWAATHWQGPSIPQLGQ